MGMRPDRWTPNPIRVTQRGMRTLLAVTVLAGALSFGGCGNVDVGSDDSGGVQPETPPKLPPAPPAATVCGVGGVAGRVCAPDQTSWVAGARVTYDGADCHGTRVHQFTTSATDGSWELHGLPTGSAAIVVSSGSFTQTINTSITAGNTTNLASGQSCFGSTASHMAVITGQGDSLESLLTDLHFQFDLYDTVTLGFQVAHDLLMDPLQDVVDLAPPAGVILVQLVALVDQLQAQDVSLVELERAERE